MYVRVFKYMLLKVQWPMGVLNLVPDKTHSQVHQDAANTSLIRDNIFVFNTAKTLLVSKAMHDISLGTL